MELLHSDKVEVLMLHEVKDHHKQNPITAELAFSDQIIDFGPLLDEQSGFLDCGIAGEVLKQAAVMDSVQVVDHQVDASQPPGFLKLQSNEWHFDSIMYHLSLLYELNPILAFFQQVNDLPHVLYYKLLFGVEIAFPIPNQNRKVHIGIQQAEVAPIRPISLYR